MKDASFQIAEYLERWDSQQELITRTIVEELSAKRTSLQKVSLDALSNKREKHDLEKQKEKTSLLQKISTSLGVIAGALALPSLESPLAIVGVVLLIAGAIANDFIERTELIHSIQKKIAPLNENVSNALSAILTVWPLISSLLLFPVISFAIEKDATSFIKYFSTIAGVLTGLSSIASYHFQSKLLDLEGKDKLISLMEKIHTLDVQKICQNLIRFEEQQVDEIKNEYSVTQSGIEAKRIITQPI